MKRGCYVLFSFILWLLASCADSEVSDFLQPEEGGNIVLSVHTGISVSRAENTFPDREIESALDSLDIFISDNNGSIVHYERIREVSDAPDKVTLKARKENFTSGSQYRVDVIANARSKESDFKVLSSLNDLKGVIQEDYRIQVSGGKKFGSIGPTITGVPDNFLMDGCISSVILNDGTSRHTSLSVVLKRAAAKIVVKLARDKEKNTILFDDCELAKQEMGYNLRNMPYTTSMLADAPAHEVRTRKTDFFADEKGMFFHWDRDTVSIATYVYSYSWNSNDFFEKGTRMTVNLPIKVITGQTESGENITEDYHDSYYQVLLTKDNSFKRNTYYEVIATIQAPGAIDHAHPETLENLSFSTRPWVQTEINIGADKKAKYLSVNKDTLDMHNIEMDATSLSFVSSSAVRATVKEVWYINMFGNKVSSDGNGNEKINYKDENDNVKSVSMSSLKNDLIEVIPDENLAGSIKVYSPIPLNNAIRYILFEVENEDNSTPEEVLVRQYPLEYITNIQGWYSYRSDFGGTTYENKGSNRYVNADWNNSKWNYANSNSDNTLFGSKVAEINKANDGTSTLKYYYWSKNGSKPTTNAGNLGSLQNARMYHVRITSTSTEYKVGIPKQYVNASETKVVNGENHYAHYIDGTTDKIKKANQELVSPSFMIASQLGATQSPPNVDVAAQHCANYVEVYKDENGNPVHLTNWRLPTEAEVLIIMKFQYVENAAMAEVLSGKQYWSATGAVLNKKKENENSTQIAVRCIRDAY